MMRRLVSGRVVSGAIVWAMVAATACGQEWISGVEFPRPPIITPGAENANPPSDAIVLFDGTDLSAFDGGENWHVANGVATVREGGVRTKQAFGDMQLHIEWSAPTEIQGEGQGRGNSGIHIMGKYEVQILDSYDNETYHDGQAASIYKQQPPMVNAMRKPGEWNTYDIIFTAPRFKVNGDVARPAYITLIHNGVVVQNHTPLEGSTAWHKPAEYEPHADKLPFGLQDHGNPVRFRNIWVREIEPIKGKRVGSPYIKIHGLP